jgi:isocitrate dehydrogenase kinase/phosphatase
MLTWTLRAAATGTQGKYPRRVPMPRDASGDVRLLHVNDLQPDVAKFMITRAFAETYRDVLDAPVPEALVAILKQMEIREVDHDRHAA